MKVLVENVKEIEDEIILITMRLNSGLSITIDSKLYKIHFFSKGYVLL